ncbi:MAG: anaerobic ribonucleoside-triphosphate reductase activating protein [Clostridia bacterium]|nr:anaerobic ribonucleoside-triphosphate reductase activating protein [Clostridia bacterium]
MKIEALQKLTLLDYPGKMAATVFTYGCNLRCPFCHNALLVTEESAGGISTEEVLSFLSKRKGMLEGVCVTGGEPLLQPDIEDFLRAIKEMGFSLKLDTNGTLPKKLKDVVSKGLVDYVAMDIKNCRDKYALTSGKTCMDLTAVDESIKFLLSGEVEAEFRTTVVKNLHTEEDLLKITDWISGCDRYFLQQFVDSGNLIDNSLSGYSDSELTAIYKQVKRKLPVTKLRGISEN